MSENTYVNINDVPDTGGFPVINAKGVTLRIRSVDVKEHDGTANRIIWELEGVLPEKVTDKDGKEVSFADRSIRNSQFVPISGKGRDGDLHGSVKWIRALKGTLGVSEGFNIASPTKEDFTPYLGKAFVADLSTQEKPVLDSNKMPTGETRTNYQVGFPKARAAKYDVDVVVPY